LYTSVQKILLGFGEENMPEEAFCLSIRAEIDSLPKDMQKVIMRKIYFLLNAYIDEQVEDFIKTKMALKGSIVDCLLQKSRGVITCQPPTSAAIVHLLFYPSGAGGVLPHIAR
jgi:hypothetical protein